MKALLIIDMQQDFMPGGSLAVPEADKLVPTINALMEKFPFVVASKDWHPLKHMSFLKWPIHCVQHSKGAEFVSSLNEKQLDQIIYKGVDPHIDSYSAFFDNDHKHSTGLDQLLKEKGVDELYVVGVATEYCVLYSVLDALRLGFKVFVIEDGCGAIKDPAEAFKQMVESGAELISSKEIKT